jgi:osmoprotectant transport system permease protein
MRWDWVGDNLGVIWGALLDHLLLVLIAITVGFAMSFIAALLVRRWRILRGPTTATFGILYTIPSLALFAFLVPFTGLTLLTAEVGLISYTLLILTRNILAGLEGIPRDISEAADGMGYTPRQRLVGVELPLAMPVIVTGLRVATVTIVGLVMVTAVIGEGGLGQLMLRGFNRQFPTMIYVGFVLTVLLGIVLDLGLILVLRLTTRWSRTAAAR